jgi:thiol-disulfide isomerase/thioredoxin
MRLFPLAIAGVLAACHSNAPSSPAGEAKPATTARAAVPGFAGATAWLNIDHALTTDELAGRVVVVDFWTSCCINCMQTLPTLAAVEDKFQNDAVVVIGVHSPKFDAETERTRLSDAVRQYSIKHPVAIDGSMAVWNAWHVQSWPTVIVLDSHGREVWRGSGEPDRKTLESIVQQTLAEAERDGSVTHEPLTGLAPERDDSGPLAFPGKVAVLSDRGLAISDTGHHRIVLVDATGKVTATIGSGLAGNTDGAFAEASFRKPQGVTQLGRTLYVADTENHELRAIDLDRKVVTTVAGTGELGHTPLVGQVAARSFALRSPWDVLAVGDKIDVALAGSHQIAVFDPSAATLALLAGDGVERRRDGPGVQASFAQPSGLASDGKTLFVADSETSSIRAIDLATTAVTTIVGRDLFVFGDVDGAAADVRLKHPIGIGFGAGSLWVADTYNSKLKRIDPATGVTKTFAGGAERVALFEPTGVAIRGNQVVVADTDHHRLVTFEVATGSTAPIALDGLTAPARGVAITTASERPRARPDQQVALGATSLTPGSALHVAWQLGAGTGINEDAPFRVHFLERSDGALPADIRGTGRDVPTGFDLAIAPSTGTTPSHFRADLDVVVCDVVSHRVCLPVRREISFDVRFGAAGQPLVLALPAAP